MNTFNTFYLLRILFTSFFLMLIEQQDHFIFLLFCFTSLLFLFDEDLKVKIEIYNSFLSLLVVLLYFCTVYFMLYRYIVYSTWYRAIHYSGEVRIRLHHFYTLPIHDFLFSYFCCVTVVMLPYKMYQGVVTRYHTCVKSI